MDTFKEGLQVIGAPCNQFGLQELWKDNEILPALKHVRPGNGFQPKFPLLKRADVNGAKALELFKFLKSEIMMPFDGDKTALCSDATRITWAPVCRNDITWNFAKFLIDRTGRVAQRYSPRFEPKEIARDIKTLLA